ncbi:S8 family serine peptidase [Deinococcus sp. QL22]|uniref:S8 family serine peptidase n=1 Tax=Deinococcus sp. QL22 TaxID=2939437 RepID=UPI0020183C0C|nr:S8 family serine peptidase [Deinococcus sp. QL22]UQN07098.1 S8 family serine peptidase [Deinococcus sp. QL22]
MKNRFGGRFRAALLGGLLLGAGLLPAAQSIKAIPALPPRSTPPAVPPPTIPPPPLPELRPTSPAPLPELSPVAPSRPSTPSPVRPTPATPTPAARSGLPRPTDPLYVRQQNLQTIDLEGAWAQLPAVLSPVTVAVLDTGYIASPELAGRVINGYDFVSDAARAGDGNGRDTDATGLGALAYHAELVGNIIGAAHDGRGMAGIAPRVRVVQIRVAGTDGLIDPQDLADSLRWAAGLTVAGVPTNPNPARILNLSLYADFIPLTRCDARVQAAVDAITARGALVIAGAANDGKDAGGYSPAGCRGVLTITSVNDEGVRPSYANWGRTVALAAPGGEVGRGIVASSLSGVGGVREPNGTSFAAPHAAGVAALLLGVRPKLSPTQLRSLLTGTATPFPSGQCDPDPARTCGAGTLNAGAALRAALASSLGK